MSEQNKTYTIGEVLAFTIDELRSVNVPAELVDSIGVPVSRALHNLKMCWEAWEAEQKARKAQQNPEVKVFETGTTDKIPDNVVPIQPEGGEAYAEKDQLEGTVQE